MRRLLGTAIVVVLLGTVGALAICAIPKVRAAAARSECQNNLKQLGMAMQNSYDTYGKFPSATLANENLSCGNRLSWLVDLLGFANQMYIGIDRTKSWDSEENRIPTTLHFPGPEGEPGILVPMGNIKLFRCPTDTTTSPADRASLTNYVGISGVGPDAAEQRIGYPGVGFFGCEREIKREDIKDGLANTLAVMETNAKLGPWTAGGFATVRPVDPATVPYLGAGRPFGSGHRSGTLALCADGSVHFLANGTSPEVLEALATIAGGEDMQPLVD